MPGKRWNPDDLTYRRGKRPFTATLAMHREELEAFELLAAVHGYQGIVPFLRRMMLDACEAHGIATGTLDEYPLPGALEVTRDVALRRAAVAGTYTPPPRWWLELEEERQAEQRRARAAAKRQRLEELGAPLPAARRDASRGPRVREAAEADASRRQASGSHPTGATRREY